MIFEENEVCCQWCSENFDIADDFNLLDEGDHKCWCAGCGREFMVNTMINRLFEINKSEE